MATLVDRLKAAEKELDRNRLANARAAAADAAGTAERIAQVRLVAQRMPSGLGGGDLRLLAGDIRGRLGADPAVVALIAEPDPANGSGTVPYLVATNSAAQELGLRADELARDLAAALGGRGGGKADLAQGSGQDASGIDAALGAVRSAIARSAPA